eukprot:4391751-Pleurochrysis_carterae.AAC.1
MIFARTCRVKLVGPKFDSIMRNRVERINSHRWVIVDYIVDYIESQPRHDRPVSDWSGASAELKLRGE